MLKSNFEISLKFLQFIYPQGPWMLTAISVDKKSIDARTFQKNETAEALQWLEANNQKNLYYSVNEPIKSAYEKRKLAKTDVYQVHFLHVDLDPREGEDVEAEQKRIRKELENYHIKPSAIVFSGGGFNALWRLTTPLHVARGSASDRETNDRAVDIERRNWQFELDFNTPDHCRDISRILRLPGTINRPDSKKIAKGRVPALADIIELNDSEYPYSGFVATPIVAVNKSANSKTTDVEPRRIDEIDELRIPEKLKIIIAQGKDPDNNKWDNDRSGLLYFVCCELVRSGVKDDIILGLITDPRFGISASVLDKGNNVMRYAHRQVERARDFADHPLLAEMNEKFAVILSYGSQSVVMVEDGKLNVETGLSEPVFQTFRAFRDRIKNYQKIPVSEKKSISAYEWWTSHPRRREYLDVTFAPGLDTPNRYNLWRGFSCSPLSGNKHESLLEHMRNNICSANEEYYDYLLKWMARVVQYPRTCSMVAPVLLGDRGTGKSVFANYFGAIFEPHCHTVSDTNALTGKFNAHLGQCVFVLAEEAFDIRDKRHESVLKEHITGRTISIERKGLDRIQMPNYAHLIMTSNNERVVPAGDFERRFFVLRVSSNKRQNSEYFRNIIEDQKDGGVANLLHYLLSIDLSDYDVTSVPQTEELREQQEHNLPLEVSWLLEKLDSGQWLQGVGWEGPIVKAALHEDYKAYHSSLNARTRARGARAFHKFIMQQLPGTEDKQAYISSGASRVRPMVFIFPSLKKCRQIFDEMRGWRTDWKDVEEEPKGTGDVVNFTRNPFE